MAILVIVNKGDHRFSLRSSSAWAKKAEARFRISFARLNSLFSFSNALNRARSSEVNPSRRPVSISTRFTQPRRGRCQTNWIGPIGASIEGSQAASWRHSARAAVRCCLKTSRRVRWRWWLKWLWIEAWTAANFCRVLMSLNRAIAPSRLRNG